MISLTTNSEKKVIERAKTTVAYGYIIKPFQNHELIGAMEAALYKKEKKRRLRESKIELKRFHDELKCRVEERTNELNMKTKNLEELNAALIVLLDKRDEDKVEIEEKILSNVKTPVEHYFVKFKKISSIQGQNTIINAIESNLNEIISFFSHRLSSKYLNLSPSEIQVSNLVKHGKTNKKMAEILHETSRAIAFHRKHI